MRGGINRSINNVFLGRTVQMGEGRVWDISAIEGRKERPR